MRVLLPLKKKDNELDGSNSEGEYFSEDEEQQQHRHQLNYPVDESELLADESPQEGESKRISVAAATDALVKKPGSTASTKVEESLCLSVQEEIATTSERQATCVDTSTAPNWAPSSVVTPKNEGAAAFASLHQQQPTIHRALPGVTSTEFHSNNSDNCKPAAQPKTNLSELKRPISSEVGSVAVHPSSAFCPTNRRPSDIRSGKRSSLSPPLDSKQPASKNRRANSYSDCKPAALRRDELDWFTSMGGGRRFSDREDYAELDVCYGYPQENDPASAWGGGSPSLSSSTPNPTVSVTANDATGAAASTAAVARDDAEEDAREEPSLATTTGCAPQLDSFAKELKRTGLEIIEQDGDGNCLFRAISLQVYGDSTMHEEVRQRCLDFMSRDKEHFSQFITDEPFDQYIRRKRRDGVHGNNPEIQAASELFNRPIEVFVAEKGATPLNIFHAEYKTQDTPIRLSYHDGNHYNAVIDPLVPTAGLGLGLPGLQPGLADKMQLAKAVEESDRLADQKELERALEESQNDQLQRAIKESSSSMDQMYNCKALSLSDCDATNFELEQAVLESSLESFRVHEHGRKRASSSSKAPSANSTRLQAALNLPQNYAYACKRDASPINTLSVASMPPESCQDAGGKSLVPRAASVTSATASIASAAAPAAASRLSSEATESNESMASVATSASANPTMVDEYPSCVQELAMNGFELPKVIHAYELVGDDFDAILSLLMAGQS